MTTPESRPLDGCIMAAPAAARRGRLLLLAALAVPAVVYAPVLTAPLAITDDHDMYLLAGLTDEGRPGVWGCMRPDMYGNGRFRPLFWLERVALARWIGPEPAVLRLLPYLVLLATAGVLFAAAVAMRMGPWPAAVLAWLVVLSPTGSQTWIMLAPQERMGMFWVALAILAMIRGASSPRRLAWQALGASAAAAAALTKESFTLTLGGVMAVPVAADVLLAGSGLGQSLRRNAWLLVLLAAVGAAVGMVDAALALRPETFTERLVSQIGLAKGLGRVARQVASSNAFFVPVLAFAVVFLGRKGHRDPSRRTAALLVAAAVLLWLVPTLALQAKIGSAVRRYVFPLAGAVAFANALAYWRVRACAPRSWRILADAAMVLWLAYCALVVLGRATEFRAQACLYHDVVATIVRDTRPHGRVLVTTDVSRQTETIVSLRRFVQGQGRWDLRLDYLDAPAEPLRPGTPAWPEGLDGRRFNVVAAPELADYDAVLAMPPDSPIRGLDPPRLADFGRPVEFRRRYFNPHFGSGLSGQVVARVYLRPADCPSPAAP